jgi:single-strand DNA-binding protein
VYEPTIELTGHLGADPELRFTPNGHQVVELRVATTRRFKVGEEWQDGETMWFNVSCWKQLAEHAAESLHKGDKVVVTGRLSQSSWTREDGSVSSKLVIDATAVGIDLSRAPVKVMLPVREGSAAATFAERWADEPVLEEVAAA